VGTNAVIGFMVDAARIVTYAVTFFLATGSSPIGPDQWPLIVTGMLAAFTGVLVGKRFVHKVTMKAVQVLVGPTSIFLGTVFPGIGSGRSSSRRANDTGDPGKCSLRNGPLPPPLSH